MVKLSACVEMLFSEHPFEKRLGLAKACGFDGYEFWAWDNKDLPALLQAQQQADIPLAGCCIATRDPARKQAFADGSMLKRKNAQVYAEMVGETIEVMRPFGVNTFITTTGQALDQDRETQQEAVIECLRAAAPIAEKAGAVLVLEPLNVLVNHKGYYLDTSKQAFEIVRAVNSPAVRLLFDMYHQQITEGNLTDNIRANIDLIGHFHLADVPGRHQPGTGEINYDHMMRVVDALPYDKYVGCEYGAIGASEEEAAKLILSYAHR